MKVEIQILMVEKLMNEWMKQEREKEGGGEFLVLLIPEAEWPANLNDRENEWRKGQRRNDN